MKSDEAGRFSFETKAATIAVYAYAANGAAAIYREIEMPQQLVELKMLPTVDYQGRILGKDGKPMVNQRVVASVESYKGWDDRPFPRRLRGNQVETTTDAAGNYTLKNVPVGVRLVLRMENDSPQQPGRQPGMQIGQRFLQPGEQRPLDVTNLAPRVRASVTVEQRLESMLKNCELYHLRLLLVTVADQPSMEFADDIIDADDDHRALLGYLPMVLDASSPASRDQVAALHKKYKWPAPEKGKCQFMILDPKGKEISRLVMNSKSGTDTKPIFRLIAEHEPQAQNATKAFAAALAEAKRTNRVVWAQHSQTRCGPCYLLSRWIDQHRTILEKQFVFVKIDDVREQGGPEIVKQMTQGKHYGIPFVAIFDGEGKRLIDSDGPLGNFGFPSRFEEIVHLKAMITKTGQQISQSELNQLIESLSK